MKYQPGYRIQHKWGNRLAKTHKAGKACCCHSCCCRSNCVRYFAHRPGNKHPLGESAQSAACHKHCNIPRIQNQQNTSGAKKEHCGRKRVFTCNFHNTAEYQTITICAPEKVPVRSPATLESPAILPSKCMEIFVV